MNVGTEVLPLHIPHSILYKLLVVAGPEFVFELSVSLPLSLQSVDIQQQLTFLLSRSPSLEELSLEASGIKL